MSSIDEKNIEILENALSNALKINNTDFSDDIEDYISLKLIKKIAEIEISKIEYGFDGSLESIIGIILAFAGIGLSEIILGINLESLTKDLSAFSWYYIKFGTIIIFLGILIAILVWYYLRKVSNDKMKRFNFFQGIILKIEGRIS